MRLIDPIELEIELDGLEDTFRMFYLIPLPIRDLTRSMYRCFFCMN
jgi:hypothetical protein